MPEMTLFEEKSLRIESARIGVRIALSELGLVQDVMCQREAYRKFTEAVIMSLVNEGLITKIKMGPRNSKVFYSKIEIETVMNLKAKRKIK